MQQIQTEKFSDVSVLVRSLLPLERRTITAYNLLVFMLKSKTADFDSKQKLSIALNHAYGMKVSYGLTGYGRQVALDIRFQYIRPERVKDPDYIHEVVHMMDQILHHALFDQKSFEEAKYLLASRLRRQNDDPDSLALKMAFALAAEDHDIAIPIQGALEDIEALSYEEVVALYESWRALPRFVSCCGTLEPVMEAFLNAIPQFEKPSLRMALIPRTSPSFQVLEKNIAQTSIVQVWATSTPIDSSRYYPLLVLNSILGQGPMSLLFEEVREKNSLCYSI
ncbi:pitrilysin family protein, partial [uncultured Dubosiella sp.]